MVVLTSFTEPTDGIRHRQPQTTVYVNDNNLGKGTLYIAESQLSWIGASGDGFSLDYPHISLHAISRDLTSFPQECLFLMLDTALGDEENNEENGVEDHENGTEEQGTTELRLVPDDRGMLDAMFHAMNACQALHPDPDDSFSDEDLYEDADDEIPMEETDSRMASLRIENIDVRSYMMVGRGVDMEVGAVEEGTVEERVFGRSLGNREVEGNMEAEVGEGVASGDRRRVAAGDRRAGDMQVSEQDTMYIQVDTEEEDRVGVGVGVDSVRDRTSGISAYRNDLVQRDRSFSWCNTRTPNTMAHSPLQPGSHTDLHFDDVEN